MELGRENKDVVVCDADLSKSTMTTYFAKEFPDRFFECGIAEANMVAIGSGSGGKPGRFRSYPASPAFVMNKGFEQLRVTAAYPHVNLKVVGTHSGISIGEDGPSQMSIEDLSLACSLPGFVVLSPADEVSTKALVKAAAAHIRPRLYSRRTRRRSRSFITADQQFEIGKGSGIGPGKDVTIIATGLMTWRSDTCRAGARSREPQRAGAGPAHDQAARSWTRSNALRPRREQSWSVEEHLVDSGWGPRGADRDGDKSMCDGVRRHREHLRRIRFAGSAPGKVRPRLRPR